MFKKVSQYTMLFVILCQITYGSYKYEYCLSLLNFNLKSADLLKCEDVLQKRLLYINCKQIQFSSDKLGRLFVSFTHENSIPEKIKGLFELQGNFEMKLLYKPNELKKIFHLIDTIANSNKLQLVSNDKFTIFDYLHPYKEQYIGVRKQNRDFVNKIINNDVIKNEMITHGIKCDILWEYSDLYSNDHYMNGIYFVKRNVKFTFDEKSHANISYSLINNLSMPSVEVVLGDMDRRMFARIAKIYNTHFLAIIMDDFVFQAPVISYNMKIDSFIMTYQISKDNAEIISGVFNSGPLIYPVKITSKKITEIEN